MRSYKRPYISKARINTDVRIESYKKAYFNVYGKVPKVLKAGAWIYIPLEEGEFHTDGIKNIRSKDLPKIIHELNLKEMEKNPYQEDKYYIGSTYIKGDIVKLFFERLFDKCNHSAMKLEDCLMDYSLGNNLTHGLRPSEDGFMNDCDGCAELYEANDNAEKFSVQAEGLKESNVHLEREIKELGNISVQRETHYKGELEKLKSQSILFSMDDFEMKTFDEEEGKINASRVKYDDDPPF